MVMPGRNAAVLGGNYRYGVNGQEKENEITSYEAMSSAEYWMYDSRLGRRWEVDPITYPWQSPYATFNNNPIKYNDVQGLEGKSKEEPKKKKEEQTSSTDPVKKPGENWLDEVKVKPTFWEKFKGFFKKIGTSIRNFFDNLEKKINKIGPWMRSTPLGRKLYKFDVDQRLEPENNSHMSDQKKKDELEGDGVLNPNPEAIPAEELYYDPIDPTNEKTPEESSQPVLKVKKADSVDTYYILPMEQGGRVKVREPKDWQGSKDGIIQNGPKKGKIIPLVR